jgi:hypothetical protein
MAQSHDAAVRLTDHAILREEQARNFHAYEEVRALPASDRDTIFDLLLEAQAGKPDVLRALHTLVYDEVPVGMEEYILGRRFLNLRGLINVEKMDLLMEFDKPYVRKCYCACGSGGGKSFMVSIVQSRQIYKLLCLRKPDLFYMLGPGSHIACINLSTSKEQARDVVFAEFLARIERSPWFKGRYQAMRTRARFQKGIYAMSGGTTATSYYGYHPIMGTLDEASYMFDGGSGSGRSIAEELSEALLKSLNTRFPRAFKLMVISTLRDTADYVYTKIEQIKDEGVCVLNRPTVQPTGTIVNPIEVGA